MASDKEDSVKTVRSELRCGIWGARYPIYTGPETKMAREYEAVGVPKTFILD